MCRQLQANLVVVFVNLVGVFAAVGNHAAQAHVVVFSLGTNRLHDAVHGENRIKVVGRDDEGTVSVLQWRSKTAAHHVAQHVKNHHVGVFQQVVFLQQLDRLANHIATTACPCRWAACFNTHHAVVARENKVFHPQLFSMKVYRLQHVNDGGQHFFGEGEGGVMLGVAANLQHPLAHF